MRQVANSTSFSSAIWRNVLPRRIRGIALEGAIDVAPFLPYPNGGGDAPPPAPAEEDEEDEVQPIFIYFRSSVS